ncbi:MAG: AarF/ABC1/UbiB kinase family protein [Isosphaeraceae bacterium]
MLRETVVHLRDLPRYRQILATMIRHGYWDIVQAMRLEAVVGPIERALGVPPQQGRPERLRRMCEDLGPAFVKLGQLLSTRPDILPPAYLVEMAKLRDDVKPFPYEEAEAILAMTLGRPPLDVFADIETEPVASASISQVHRARMQDGRLLALKIRRPEIEKVVQADLDILKNLAELAERQIPALAPYRPVTVVREFERSMKREIDLRIELRTMQRCRSLFEGDANAHIPAVYPEYSGMRVLAMEYIDGLSVDDPDSLRRHGIDPVVVAQKGAAILLTQIFRHGSFHADPHPGNLRVLPGPVIAPLDYGMFGRIETPTRERIADLLIGLITQDTDRVLRDLDALEIRGDDVDRRVLRRDVGELVASYSDLSLDTIDLTVLLRELVELIRTHRLRIPPDLILLIRSLVTIEGVGRRLDPHFDIASQLEPFLRSVMFRRVSPARLFRESARTASDFQRVATLLPDVLYQSLESIRRGELTVKFDLQHFERLVQQLTRASNSLSAGIVIAGIVVGSSLIVRQENLAWLGTGGFALASLLGLGLMWNMFRRT